MSGNISADTIVGSSKSIVVNNIQQASDVATAIGNRVGTADARL